MLVPGLTKAAAVVVLRAFIHKYMLSRQKTLRWHAGGFGGAKQLATREQLKAVPGPAPEPASGAAAENNAASKPPAIKKRHKRPALRTAATRTTRPAPLKRQKPEDGTEPLRNLAKR